MSTNNFPSLRAFVKAASALPDKKVEGEPFTGGAHANANAADAKKVVPGNGIEAGKDNPVTGSADKPIPHSGLKQTTVGKMPEVEDAVKVVTEATDKVAAADLSTPEGFAEGLAQLKLAYAAFPALLASAGVRVQASGPATPAATPTPAKSAAESAKAAVDAQVAALVDSYRNHGAVHGSLTAAALRGFHGAYSFLEKAAADGSMDAALAGPAPDATAPAPAAEPAAPPPDAAAAPAGPAGDPAAGGGQPSLEDIAAALAESGITPDQLMQVAQMMASQAGSAPDAGGPPAPEAGGPSDVEKAAFIAEMRQTCKIAQDVKAMMREGRFELKPVAEKSAARKSRDVAKSYIRELAKAGGL